MSDDERAARQLAADDVANGVIAESDRERAAARYLKWLRDSRDAAVRERHTGWHEE